MARLESLYLMNATVLIAHEIDAAYWHEWEMFYLPGSVQGFVLLHLLLLPAVLYGYREVVCGGRHGKTASLLLAGVGLFAAVLHSAFILYGDKSFSLPLSRFLLGAAFILSLIQIIAAARRTDSNN